MLGLPEGGYAAPAYYVAGEAPYALATADFNHDGKPDLVASNQNSSNLTVFLGNGDGTFATGAFYPVGLYPYSIAIADFDEDGISDLGGRERWQRHAVGPPRQRLGRRRRRHGSPRRRASASAVSRAASRAGDLDRDGITDLVHRRLLGRGRCAARPGQRAGSGTARSRAPSTSRPAPGRHAWPSAISNADTLADLAVANYTSNRVSVLLHGCGSPPPPPPESFTDAHRRARRAERPGRTRVRHPAAQRSRRRPVPGGHRLPGVAAHRARNRDGRGDRGRRLRPPHAS